MSKVQYNTNALQSVQIVQNLQLSDGTKQGHFAILSYNFGNTAIPAMQNDGTCNDSADRRTAVGASGWLKFTGYDYWYPPVVTPAEPGLGKMNYNWIDTEPQDLNTFMMFSGLAKPSACKTTCKYGSNSNPQLCPGSYSWSMRFTDQGTSGQFNGTIWLQPMYSIVPIRVTGISHGIRSTDPDSRHDLHVDSLQHLEYHPTICGAQGCEGGCLPNDWDPLNDGNPIASLSPISSPATGVLAYNNEARWQFCMGKTLGTACKCTECQFPLAGDTANPMGPGRIGNHIHRLDDTWPLKVYVEDMPVFSEGSGTQALVGAMKDWNVAVGECAFRTVLASSPDVADVIIDTKQGTPVETADVVLVDWQVTSMVSWGCSGGASDVTVISQQKIRLNDAIPWTELYYSSSPPVPAYPNGLLIGSGRRSLAHEFGHVLGLAHEVNGCSANCLPIQTATPAPIPMPTHPPQALKALCPRPLICEKCRHDFDPGPFGASSAKCLQGK